MTTTDPYSRRTHDGTSITEPILVPFLNPIGVDLIGGLWDICPIGPDGSIETPIHSGYGTGPDLPELDCIEPGSPFEESLANCAHVAFQSLRAIGVDLVADEHETHCGYLVTEDGDRVAGAIVDSAAGRYLAAWIPSEDEWLMAMTAAATPAPLKGGGGGWRRSSDGQHPRQAGVGRRCGGGAR
jgi:hypothetical protein